MINLSCLDCKVQHVDHQPHTIPRRASAPVGRSATPAIVKRILTPNSEHTQLFNKERMKQIKIHPYVPPETPLGSPISSPIRPIPIPKSIPSFSLSESVPSTLPVPLKAPRTLFEQALVYKEKGDLTSSLTCIEKYLETPGSYENLFQAYYLKAELLIKLEKYKPARHFLDHAVTVVRDPKLFLISALLNCFCFDFDKALEDMRTIISMKPILQVSEQNIFAYIAMKKNRHDEIMNSPILAEALKGRKLKEEKEYLENKEKAEMEHWADTVFRLPSDDDGSSEPA